MMAAVFIWQPESLFLLSFSMTPAAKGLAISFSNTSVAILYLKKAIITVKEKWKCVYVNQARLCAHPHIVDVYDSTPWTKELYNILLLIFFSSLDFVSLHPSLSQLKKPTMEMYIVIYIMMKFSGPNQVFEFHHIQVSGRRLSAALKIIPSERAKSMNDSESKRPKI